ncbi:hypothetical protein QQM79_15925 [Marinobacteraceae bacterium S3BR75-40.1]
MKTVVLVTLLTMAAVLGGLWFTDSGPVSPPQIAAAQPASSTFGDSNVAKQTSLSKIQVKGFVDTLADELKAEFGTRIKQIAVQAQLYTIRQKVLERFPDQGARYFEQAVRRAFPEQADTILLLMAKLDTYHEWLATENRTLMNLTPVQRLGRIWQKRQALFGDWAEQIWADERNALASKRKQMQSVLARLNQTPAANLEETLFQLRTALDETFDGPWDEVINQRGMITQVFFSLDSVQNTLDQLPPDQRQTRIDQVRRKMGYDEEQITRLRKQDQWRNERWKNGKAYMAEREQVAAEADGLSREAALQKLREKYFGREAKTIRLEEENGFFRYERPRYYGRN